MTTALANDFSYDLTGDQNEFLDASDRFGREVLHPLAEKMDAEESWPDGVMQQMGELGFLGITVPEEYGGAGLDLWTAGIVTQGLSRWNHAFALSWVAHDNLCVNNIYANGNEAQRKKYLPKLCSGEHIGALALTEPGAGSDALGSMATTATLDGDHYVLNGTKLFITNGPIADVLLVYAKTDKAKGQHGISAFIVEQDFPGFSVAQKLTKMGFRGSQTGELVFDNCRVPVENLVGEHDRGVRVVMSGLDLERAMISPLCLGVCERALELSTEYAQTREQFGQEIGKFQAIQTRLADIYVGVETLRTFTHRVLAACNTIGHGEAGKGDIHMLTAASVRYAADTMNMVLDNALHIHGGSGYIWESEINRLYRSTKLLEIGAGTTEVRNMIIAGELLKQ
ncbi:MAG: acyl-CoA dehydrogenase family protein [Alphaproteobacteria bacterium]